jgi:hypothetical protein
MGLWVMFTPLAYRGVSHPGAAFWSAIATGSLVLLTALSKSLRPSARWLSWITLLAGCWLMVSSVVLSAPTRAATDATVVGLLIVLASLASAAGTSLGFDVRRNLGRESGRARHRRHGHRPFAV